MEYCNDANYFEEKIENVSSNLFQPTLQDWTHNFYIIMNFTYLNFRG